MSFTLGKFRAGDGTGSPIVPAGTSPDTSQGRFRASDAAAPSGPSVPIVPPTPGTPIGMPITSREALLLWDLVPEGVTPPPGKDFAPIDTDWSWRWLKHHPILVPEPGLTPYISYTADGVRVEQAPIASGGGSFIGDLTPYMTMDGSSVLVDPLATPIWTILVAWDTLGPVQLDGTPPTRTSSSATMPATPTITKQPIIGDSFTDGPWLLYLEWDAVWVGTSGAWSLILTEKLVLSYGGSGGPTTFLIFDSPPGGTTAVELDNTHNRIRCSLDPSLQIATPVGDPGGWPANQIFGGGNMQPNFSPSFRHLNGHFTSVSIIPQTLEETVALLSERSLIPGTGPPTPRIAFRAADAPNRALPARLSEYALYWPLDDAGPGPMYDLVIGAYLTVQNPTYATFRVDGIVNPLSPTHTKALHLARASDSASATRAFLEWSGAGPVPSLGLGAAGDDLTVSCWILWEGPPPDTNGSGLDLFRGSLVPSGPANVPSLQASIIRDAEPYGIEFETFQSSTLTYKKIDTVGFDWPADFALDFGNPLLPYVTPIPYKAATWALLTLVMRTVGGHMTIETWVDGVLVASGPGSDTGWGTAVSLFQFAHNLAPCTIQHLTVWPFALTATEISGLAAA